jgi:uncharacterized protein (DUF433 family)
MAQSVATEPVPLARDADGVMRVAGTRVTLDTVITAYKNGDTPEQIAQDYSALEAADIYAVIAYYLRHRQELDTYLERRQEEARAVREDFEKRFPSDGLKERLQRRLR